MVRPELELLAGTVEVDEVYVTYQRGAEVKYKRIAYKGQDGSHLVAVALAVEVDQP